MNWITCRQTFVQTRCPLPGDQALKTLQGNSFRVTMRTRRDPNIPAGSAIETVPRAGSVAPRASVVELVVSAGR